MTTLNPTHGCEFTTLINGSGSSKTYSFLAPHGRTLADGHTVSYLGDLASCVARSNRLQEARNLKALAVALAAGDLAIVATPCPVYYDTTRSASYRIGVENAVVTASASIDFGSHSTANVTGPGQNP